MKIITLNLSDFEKIRNDQGSEAGVEALRAEIQSHAPELNIQLELRGPNYLNQRVASLSFVHAASRQSHTDNISPNLLTCGFAEDDCHAISNLFGALTYPQDLVHHELDSVAGLVIGSFAKPTAFIDFER